MVWRVTEAYWRMEQRPLCCFCAALSWFRGLVSSVLDLDEVDVTLENAGIFKSTTNKPKRIKSYAFLRPSTAPSRWRSIDMSIFHILNVSLLLLVSVTLLLGRAVRLKVPQQVECDRGRCRSTFLYCWLSIRGIQQGGRGLLWRIRRKEDRFRYHSISTSLPKTPQRRRKGPKSRLESTHLPELALSAAPPHSPLHLRPAR